MAKPEEIVTDPVTGGMKGTKLARFDLIPPDALELLAEHYGKGAKKYTRSVPIEYAYDIIGKSCNCVKSVEKVRLVGLPKTAGVDPATKEILELTISGMQSANGRIVDNGVQKTEIIKKNNLGLLPDNDALQSLGSRKQMSMQSCNNKTAVQSVTEDQKRTDGSTWITAIPLESSEDSSVVAATKVLDSWETIQNVLSQHQRTCKSLKQGLEGSINGEIILSGDNNWRLGYKWGLSFAALMRHAFAFWRGEDIDEETGTPHLIAVAWHAFTLHEFTKAHPELDDRSKS